MRYLLKYTSSQYYAAKLIDIRVVSEEEYELLMEKLNLGVFIWLGEAQGKHSEVTRELGPDDIEVVQTFTEEESDDVSTYFDGSITNCHIFSSILNEEEHVTVG